MRRFVRRHDREVMEVAGALVSGEEQAARPSDVVAMVPDDSRRDGRTSHNKSCEMNRERFYG